VKLAAQLADMTGRAIAEYYGIGATAVGTIHRRREARPDVLKAVETLSRQSRKAETASLTLPAAGVPVDPAGVGHVIGLRSQRSAAAYHVLVVGVTLPISTRCVPDTFPNRKIL